MKGKTISAAVRKYAKAWQSEMLKESPGDGRRSPLNVFVEGYLDNIFKQILNTLMGVKSDGFDRLELVEPRDDDASPSVASLLMKKSLPRLMKLGEQLFATADLQFSKREIDSLQKQYRKHMLWRLEERIGELASERADAIAESELNKLLNDPEWIAGLEDPRSPKNDPTDDE